MTADEQFRSREVVFDAGDGTARLGFPARLQEHPPRPPGPAPARRRQRRRRRLGPERDARRTSSSRLISPPIRQVQKRRSGRQSAANFSRGGKQ